MHDPDMYDTYSQFQRRDALELVPILVSKMRSKGYPESVLDLGCGTGYNTRNIILPSLVRMAGSSSSSVVDSSTSPVPISSSGLGEGESGPKIYAIDLSRKMIQFASIKYDHPNVTYMVADVMKDDCEFPCKFDKIFSLHVLHWISDHEKALRSLFWLLKTNGEIAFYYISSAAVFSVYYAMSKIPTWKSYLLDVKNFIPKSYFSFDPAKDTAELMTSIGYHVQEASNATRTFCFDSFKDMIDAAMAANPFVHRIPAHLKESYKRDFQNCFTPFVRHTPGPSNPDAIEVDYGIVIIRAERLA